MHYLQIVNIISELQAKALSSPIARFTVGASIVQQSKG